MNSPAAIDIAVRIGTRGSALARVQANLVADALAAAGTDHELVVVTTAGDQRAPDTVWGEGAFVTAIEQALVLGEVDVAVHSAKDVPTDEDPRLTIAAYLPRAEPRDALVLPAGCTDLLATLPAGTIIGTDSPRRTGFLLAHRPDLRVRPLHGNVDTRLRRLDDGEVGALMLAAAGLTRLGRTDRINELIDVEIVPPAPGQGAIAVQVRADDALTLQRVGALDDVPTRAAVEAERAFLKGTGGGCRAPIGALADIDGDQITLLGGFATLDGRASGIERIEGRVDDRRALAAELATRLTLRRANLPGAPRVLITRPEEDSRRLVASLAERGIATTIVPAIEIELDDAGPHMTLVIAQLQHYDWIVVTSPNGARAIAAAAERAGTDLAHGKWAAVGGATARPLRDAGARDIWQPTEASAAALGRELPVEPGSRVARVRGDLADSVVEASLDARGASVSVVTAYKTLVGPRSSAPLLARAMNEVGLAAVIFSSPSAVAGLLEIAAYAGANDGVRSIAAICVGAKAADTARAAGFDRVVEAPTQDAGALADLSARVIAAPTQDAVEGTLA